MFFNALWIDRKQTDVGVGLKVAQQQIEPTLTAATQAIDAQCLLGLDSGKLDQRGKGPVAEFHVSDVNATHHRLGNGRFLPQITGRKHRRPDASQHVTNNDFLHSRDR